MCLTMTVLMQSSSGHDHHIDRRAQRLIRHSYPSITLALFHTAFNVLGVMLMWPLASRLALLPDSSERLGHLLRMHRYQANSVRLAMDAAPLMAPQEGAREWAEQHKRMVQALRLGEPSAIEDLYEPLKVTVLNLGATGQLPLAQMETALAQYSSLRKAAQQAGKAQAMKLSEVT